MKYFAEFHSINSKLYRIEIHTPSGSETQELKLSGTPFVASVKSDEKHLYSPIRCGGATVGLLAKEPLFNLYSGQAQGVKVTLFSGENSDSVEWVGYVSPTMYNQGFDDEWEEINVDCVDGIAVLKDVPFRAAEKTIMTFLDLIFYCLKASDCYRNFHISDNVQLKANGTESVIEKFRISSSNFFSDKKDISQTDDDVAWSCYDVLYHICQWLGYTVISEGDEVFIIDYDAIRNGRDSYFKYSLEGNSPGTGNRVTVAYSKTIAGKDYAGNNAKISLDEIYNKVTVKDEFHTYDNLFPAFGDENYETNLTAPVSDLSGHFHAMTPNDHGMGFGDHLAADPSILLHSNCVVTLSSDWSNRFDYLNFYKIMESPVFVMHKYDRNTRKDVTDDPRFSEGNFSYNDIFSFNGAFYLRYASFNAESFFYGNIGLIAWANAQKNGGYNYRAPVSTKYAKWVEAFKNFNLSNIKMEPMIVMVNTGDNRFGPGDEIYYNAANKNDVTKNYPFVTLRNKSSSSIFGGAGHYLKIKGNITCHDDTACPFPIKTDHNGSLKYEGDNKAYDQGYIWCKVKWGDRWWNGKGWSDSECWFELYLWTEDESYRKVRTYYAQSYEIRSNQFAKLYPGEDGYVIPCPEEGNLNGTAEVAFTTRDMWGDSKRGGWHPSGSKFDNYYCRYLNGIVLITNLSITAEVSPGLLSDADLDSDTLYTNVIENGSISEMDQIAFKVCTDDQKKPSYSSVDLLDGSESKFVTSLYNLSLRNKESDTEGCDGLTACLRQEEHMVFKLARQYQDPRLIFECDLHNDGHKLYGTFSDASHGSRVFILSEREIDYRFNSAKLKLSEKA